ncbi:hypothetical protein [Planococcus sp. 107-1]|uniref:hypothetical protein n=1 Tax=Planococcus sp. 107-1 TaxID=2908840 RepID=UPI001F1908B7|nr:hypothetical protein [Planococcus sp. 107-1]UJF25543.1 hypothetical protein L0M13_09700 [Planococcus sp. 107-1]
MKKVAIAEIMILLCFFLFANPIQETNQLPSQAFDEEPIISSMKIVTKVDALSPSTLMLVQKWEKQAPTAALPIPFYDRAEPSLQKPEVPVFRNAAFFGFINVIHHQSNYLS